MTRVNCRKPVCVGSDYNTHIRADYFAPYPTDCIPHHCKEQ